MSREARAVSAEERLKDLGITLPPPPHPLGLYVETLQSGNMLYLTGMLPIVDGKPQLTGRLGGNLTMQDGRKAAELAVLNGLSAARAHLGSLNKIKAVVKTSVYLVTEGDFNDHPKVADGASELLAKVLGTDKLSTRVVLGVASLPVGLAVEVELLFEIEP